MPGMSTWHAIPPWPGDKKNNSNRSFRNQEAKDITNRQHPCRQFRQNLLLAFFSNIIQSVTASSGWRAVIFAESR